MRCATEYHPNLDPSPEPVGLSMDVDGYRPVASSTGYLKGLPRIRNDDGSLKHQICEGSREHVISYSNKGQHCSEPECEINRQHSDNNGDQRRLPGANKT